VRVGVVGVGAIGGSIALRLVRKGVEVLAYDVDSRLLSLLFEKTRIKRFNLERDPVDMVILAIPMRVEEKLIRELIFSDITVMDVASVKTPFVKLAESRRMRFIGGHPMAGSIYRKDKGWDPNIFKERPFFLCQARHSKEEDRERAERLVHLLGAHPVWTTPEEHDKAVSKVSHSTYFISLTARILGKGFEDFAGPGFCSTTRLSHQNLEMVLDMVRYNGNNIVEDLKEAKRILESITQAVASDDFSVFLEGVEE